jgi:hypothetical protein
MLQGRKGRLGLQPTGRSCLDSGVLVWKGRNCRPSNDTIRTLVIVFSRKLMNWWIRSNKNTIRLPGNKLEMNSKTGSRTQDFSGLNILKCSGLWNSI